jgi:recombination protein RecA
MMDDKLKKEILKKLNKSVAKEDQFYMASDLPRDNFDVQFSSFGSPWLDYNFSGIGLGRMTLLTGWEGSGKTTYALKSLATYQKLYPNKVAAIFDGEYTIDNSYMDRMGVNRDTLLYRNGSNLEEMLNECEATIRAFGEHLGFIMIDSIKSFTSKVVEDKSAEDDTIGVEAKKLNARMGVINGLTSRRGIALVVLNQMRINPGQMFGNPETIPGGKWQRHMPSLHLHLSKGNLIIDENKNVLGQVTNIRVKKSKYGPFDAKRVYESNLYYNYGFDEFTEWTKILVDQGIIGVSKAGGWHTLPNDQRYKEKIT